ncbi:OmpA family protein [Chitinophaga sp. 212800010-3]|uniref:OmpA family protein n=1 Tax=unclassified Chitinophaga TaxID=2619133 RepID=UPI002DE256FB|nr:OmpA-like domain-containing protein [Chitinophaga sp. 212800010-3]
MKRMLSITRYCLLVAGIALLASCAASKKTTDTPHAYMTRQYEELKDVLNDAEVSIIKDSLKVIFPNNVLFATSSDQISDGIKPTFRRFADILNKYNKTSIIVSGHTDSTGSSTFNQDLSKRRAEAAKDLLKSYSVADERMMPWGMAARDPLATNSTEEGRAKNRRVQFVILYNVKSDAKN